MELKEVVKNRPVSGEYLIIENQLKTAKNGNSYLAIKIADQTGEMAVKDLGCRSGIVSLTRGW